MKTQEYLVKKYNELGCNYDNIYCCTYADAWHNTNKRDVMFICKNGSVYYGDNWQGWKVDNDDIIRIVRR